MKFNSGELEPLSIRADFNQVSKLPKRAVIDTERILNYHAIRQEDGKFSLDITFYVIQHYSKSKSPLLSYAGEYNFHIENDGSHITDDKIDLYKHITIGEQKAQSFIDNKQTELKIDFPTNTQIPLICEQISDSLVRLGFYK